MVQWYATRIGGKTREIPKLRMRLQRGYDHVDADPEAPKPRPFPRARAGDAGRCGK